MINNLLLEDLNEILNCGCDFSIFKNKVFLITGSTGLIGSLYIKSLLYISKKLDLNINVIALARSEEKFKDIFNEFLDEKNLKVYYQDIKDNMNIEEHVDYILHTASITNSKMMIEYPVEVIDIAVLGTKNVLELAKKNKSKVIYVSSMEVYGKLDNLERKVVESDLGYIDVTNIRSCYCIAKRACESMCVSYAYEYNIDVIIARLAQTFGVGVSKEDNRVFAQFAKSVIKKGNIILHTEGKSEGNYCYTTDAMSAFFYLFWKGKKAEIYNVNNEESHTTIYNMAKLVIDNFSKNEVIIDIPKDNIYGYAQDVKIHLSSKKLRNLGWNSKVSLLESYKKLIKFYRSIN